MRFFPKIMSPNRQSIVNEFEDWSAGLQTPFLLWADDAGAFDQGQSQTPALNVTGTTAAVTSSDVVSNAVSAAAVSDPAATPVPTSSPLHYFIKLDGVKGDASVNGTGGWIEVDGFDWGVKNSSTIGSAGGGGGAGKATFSPLTVDIHSLAGLATLFKDAATGDHLKTAELVGVETIKGQSLEVYKVDLSDVLVSSFEEDPGAQGVETTLALNFANIKFTDQPVTTKGTVGAPETAAFDLVENKTAAVTPTDFVFDPQLTQTALGPVTMAAGNIGSAGSQDPLLHPTLTGA
jgi:type VI secretion system secreted protein Hcp